MADWKNLGDRAKNLTLVGLGKARDLGESAKLNLDNVSEEETRRKILAEIGRRIGKNIQFTQVDSAGRALALSTGNVDVVFWVRGVSTGSKTIHMTDEEFAAYKAEMEKDFTPEEKEAIAKLDEILPRVREYTRDMPEGTIITEPYFTDIPVGVMTRELYDAYVAMIKGA